MIFKRFRPAADGIEPRDVGEDFRSSRRLEKYRLGKTALYIPAGFGWEYLPLSDISSIRRITRVIQSENGVCPFAMEVPGVRLYYHGKDMVLETEKEKSAAAVMAAFEAVRREEN